MKTGVILAIDPGNKESGYVLVEYDENDITKVIGRGKLENERLYEVMYNTYKSYMTDEISIAVEMVQSMGMPVGKEVFDTCVWIGRILEYSDRYFMKNYKFIYRADEKLTICGNMRAKDSNVRQAIIDRFAPGQPNKGKGTKKNPGFFYGFKADIWQAFAVAVTYFDKYIKKVQ